MKKYAIIVAGGEGTRLGGALPKQFREVAGRPLLWWSMKAFHEEDPQTQIILVLNASFLGLWDELVAALPEADRIPYRSVTGGTSRTGSVKNGMALVDAADSLVAIHDAARPLVTVDMISRGWEAAEKHGGAVPCVPVTDSLRHLEGDNNVAVDRSEYVAVQTPQVFRTSLLAEAYARNPEAVYSDDASAYEAAGYRTALFEGSPKNMKVTNPGDIEIAQLLLKAN